MITSAQFQGMVDQMLPRHPIYKFRTFSIPDGAKQGMTPERKVVNLRNRPGDVRAGLIISDEAGAIVVCALEINGGLPHQTLVLETLKALAQAAELAQANEGGTLFRG